MIAKHIHIMIMIGPNEICKHKTMPIYIMELVLIGTLIDNIMRQHNENVYAVYAKTSQINQINLPSSLPLLPPPLAQ